MGSLALSYLVKSFTLPICHMVLGPGGTVCMLLYLLSHVWNSWTHRSSLLIKANPWKHSAIFCIYSLMHSFSSLSVSCNDAVLCLYFNWTHLRTWRTTGRGRCQPGEGEEGRTAKKWTHPWSVSSVLLGCRCSRCHGPGSVWRVRRCSSARCCGCTPHHLHGSEEGRQRGEGAQLKKKPQSVEFKRPGCFKRTDFTYRSERCLKVCVT